MNFIEKNGKKIAIALCFATCVPVISTVYAHETQPGWHGEGAERYYVLETTREQATGWLKLDEGTYYFDEDGNLLFGWREIDGYKYYFAADGKMVTGETTIEDVTYNFQKDGRLLSGWQDDFLYDENGYPITKQFIKLGDGKYCYVDENGQKLTGWQTINEKKYYFDKDGIRASGDTLIDGHIYYLEDNGVLKTGWIEDEDGNSYYRNKYGEVLTDTTKKIDGTEYVFDEYGVATKKSADKAKKKSSASSSDSKKSSSSNSAASITSNGGIASAALAQLGVTQDCTMLVTNALAANGIYFHGWPADYFSLGTVTGNPQPGDLIYYANGGLGMAHIAVYIGNGQAVHGGWNGTTTAVSSAYIGSGPVFIHVG